MGSLRLSAWSAASSARAFPSSAPGWRGRRLHHAPLAPRHRCAPSSPPSASPSPASSLGASRLRVGTEHDWLWDCRGGDIGGGDRRDYAKEMEVAVRVVQVACTLCQRVQDSLLLSDHGSGRVHSKLDRSPVTVADWGVQAIVSWLLSDCFHDESVSIVAEEDDQTLSSSDGTALLESVVAAVNGCLVEAPLYGLKSPEKELRAHDVLQAIRKCSSTGGPKGRFWVLDPVDGTLGFVRGDQYAIALALIEDGKVVLGVLGCPNYPMKKEWLDYHQRYYRLMSKVAPPTSGSWHKGCVMYAHKGCGQAWMQPLVHDFGKLDWHNSRGYYVQHQGTTAPPSVLHAPHPGGGYRHHLDAAGPGFSFQTPTHMGPNPHIGQGQGLHVETSPTMSQPSAGAAANVKGEQGSVGRVNQDEQVKRKRGRPRKYKPDGTGTVTLGLSPSSSTPTSSSSAMVTVSTTPGSGALSEKRRGRPPGSGKMQQLASLGKWFLGSVGTGFTPHVIIISSGEDVAARIMSFSQQGPRAVCIMSATGAVSTATLHQDASSGSVVTYEGRFEILCLSGSYLVVDDGGLPKRSGGLCIALCGPDHRVIGGSVGGVLTAAGTVQVIVGSFMYAGSKKNKGKGEQEEEMEQANGGGEEETPLMLTLPHDDLSSHSMSGWPGMMRHMDSRSSNIDINSIRE